MNHRAKPFLTPKKRLSNAINLLFTIILTACSALPLASDITPADSESTAQAAALNTATAFAAIFQAAGQTATQAAAETLTAIPTNTATHTLEPSNTPTLTHTITSLPSATNTPQPSQTATNDVSNANPSATSNSGGSSAPATVTPTVSATPGSSPTATDPVSTLTIDLPTYLDKLHGGWVGQMAGVMWGETTEFACQGCILNSVPQWQPEWINRGLENDDLYVEMPFLDVLANRRVNASWDDFGENFRWTYSNLWHANKAGRDNLKNGIPAPESGHYDNNPHADDIDWQIESNFAGLVAPGMPEAAIDIAWRAGHVMNYGDGVYGGVAVAAMQSMAFFANDVYDIVEAGRLSVPEGSLYRQMIDDVIAWHAAYPGSWATTWQLVEDKYGNSDRCPNGINQPFNIDAKLNGAYVFIALLYGNGDMEYSMQIAMKSGQDSDCNPSTVGGILGTWLGYSNMPQKYYSQLDKNYPIMYSDYTYNDAINMSVNAARDILYMKGGSIVSGGSVNNELWILPPLKPIKPPILEQWPLKKNERPQLNIAVEQQNGCTFKYNATAFDSSGIKDYQWFFGDLSYASGAEVTHTYPKSGTYEVVAYATDPAGNTNWQVKWLQCP